MDVAGLMATTTEHVDVSAHGKLIVNAGGNAINALSGLDLRSMIRVRGYRRLISEACRETTEVYRALGIVYDGSGSAQYLALLSLPSPLVWLATKLLLDPGGRASMSSDLLHRRPTEINYLNGYVAELGLRAGVPTPVNTRLFKLIKDAEAVSMGSPKLSPAAIAEGLDVDVEERHSGLAPLLMGALVIALAVVMSTDWKAKSI